MPDPFAKAKNYAFLLLKFRPRSEWELCQRLRKKKFDPGIIAKTISFLKEKDFINDSYFANAWVQSRLKKPLGLRKIKQELRLKGIDKEIIAAEIERARADYAEEDIVRSLAKGRFKRLKGVDPQKAKARVFAYLMRRGFSTQTIIDTLEQL